MVESYSMRVKPVPRMTDIIICVCLGAYTRTYIYIYINIRRSIRIYICIYIKIYVDLYVYTHE